MPLHLPTLLLVSAVLTVLAACAMALFGLTQRVYRGYGAWTAAAALAAAGVVLLALSGALPALALPGHVLLLQWPLLVLHGMRRFHLRHPWRAKGSSDGLLLALAVVSALALGLASGDDSLRVAGLCGAGAALHGYAALALWTGPRESAGLRSLALGVGATAAALVVAAHAAWELGGEADARLQALTAASLTGVPAVLLMLVLSLVMTHERTERELRESRRRLRFLANIDMLTRVPNRRHFGELAQRALEREAPGSTSVLMFDIDHFKAINDRLGHAAGDRALRLVARCVQDTLRTNDVTGRHGGDEFVLLLPGTTVDEAMAVAARIVARAQALAAEEAIPRLSLSFGVVQTRSGETVDDTLRRADQALYEAKRQGRGRAVIALGDEEQPLFSESQRLGLTPL